MGHTKNSNSVISIKKLSLSICIGLALVGCSSTDLNREAQAKVAINQTLPTLPEQWTMLEKELGQVGISWLDQLDDPKLSALVEEGLKNNKSIQAAAANVDVSRALLDQAASTLSPQLSGSLSPSTGGAVEGSSSTNFNASLQASWEVDLWGRIRSGNLAAQESLEAAKADYKFAQYSLAANIAKAYFVAVEASNKLSIVQQNLKAVEKTNKIVQVQFENGMADQQDVSLAKSNLASAQEAQISSKGAQRNAIRSLELLLGRYPSAELLVDAKLPEPSLSVPSGLPSQLLERRPDLVAAERQVAAAFNKVDQAKTAKLPSLSLSSNIGGASSSLTDVLNPTNLAWKAIASIAAPIFDGGLAQAQVEAATAEQKAAVANYAQKALNAFNDVETALDQRVVVTERKQSIEIALAEAEKSLRLANLKFTEGEISLVDVLSIQQSTFSARQNMLSIKRAALSQFIDLNLALGGSWK